MIFLAPLIIGFALSGASAFTAFYSRVFGERGGRLATLILRNFIGIPLWLLGFTLAWLEPSSFIFTPVAAVRVAGWLLLAAAAVPVVWGHLSLGLKSHMPSMGDALVRGGLYGYVRHPIYSGLMLSFAGLALLRPTQYVALACGLGIVWFIVQALLEEVDLKERLPAYRQYMAEVPRFVPRMKKAGLSPYSGEPAPHTHGMLLEWLAPVYDRGCPIIGLGRRFRNTTLQYAKLKAGEHILDVGCGTGVLTRLAAKAVGPAGRVTGIDPGPKMIGIARKNALIEGSRAEFRLAVIEDLPFEDNTFDCVLSSFMVHHLPPDVKLKGLREVYRVLKPGGRLLVVDMGRPSNPLWWLLVWPFLLWSFTKDHVRGVLIPYFVQAGFSKVDTVGRWMGFPNFWLMYKPER